MNRLCSTSSSHLISKAPPVDQRIFTSIYTTGNVSISADGIYAVVSFITAGDHTLALNLT